MTGAFRRVGARDKSQFDPRKFLGAALAEMQDLCRDRFEQFGTAGKASRLKPISLAQMATRYASGALDPELSNSQSAA
jgi:fructose-bisphosphate aldolase class II